MERTAERDREERKKEESRSPDPGPSGPGPSAPSAPPPPDWTRYDPVPPPRTLYVRKGFRIETQPSGAEVYFGSVQVGQTPFEQDSSYPIRESVTLRLSGYRDLKFDLYSSGKDWDVSSFTLTPITGTLVLDDSFSEAVVTLQDQKNLQVGFNRVKVGNQDLVARRFGFEDFKASLLVKEEESQSLSAVWIPADLKPLTLSLVPPWRTPTGRVAFDFEVSAPGVGSLEILGPGGKALSDIPLGPFTRRSQSVFWEPRQDLREVLEPGLYTARLTVGDYPPLQQVFQLQRTLEPLPSGEFWSSASGSLFSPAARTLPPKTFSLSASVLGTSGGGYLQALANTALLLGLSPGWELDVSFANRIWNDSYLNSFYWTVGLKNSVLDTPWAAVGWYASGSLSGFWDAEELIPPTTDPFTNPLGAKLGVAFTLDLGEIKLHGAPELAYLGRGVSYESSDQARRGWAPYLRGALEWETEAAVIRGSTALRLGLLEDGVLVKGPYQAGVELRLRPGESVGVNLLGVLEWWNPSDWALSLGAGISLTPREEEDTAVRRLLPRGD